MCQQSQIYFSWKVESGNPRVGLPPLLCLCVQVNEHWRPFKRVRRSLNLRLCRETRSLLSKTKVELSIEHRLRPAQDVIAPMWDKVRAKCPHFMKLECHPCIFTAASCIVRSSCLGCQDSRLGFATSSCSVVRTLFRSAWYLSTWHTTLRAFGWSTHYFSRRGSWDLRGRWSCMQGLQTPYSTGQIRA